jgi:glycosyltransferase involved in cell wall biosynthesis
MVRTSAPPAAGQLHLVLPAPPAAPGAASGGDRYDQEMSAALRRDGWRVRHLPVPGSWPRPDPEGPDRVRRALAALPDGATVLLDGLIACAVPEVVEPASARLRLAVVVHLPLADETGLPPRVARDLDARERRSLRAAAAVIAPARAAAERLVARHGLDPARVHAVPPGVHAAPPSPGSSAGTQLLCAAAVTPRKGQDVLVEALADLTDLPWRLGCAGPVDRDPAYVTRVRDLVAARGLARRVTFTGPLGPGELARAWERADLLVLASRAEPYGMVVTEALARGVPVVAPAVDGVPEALGRAPDGQRPGLLVPPGDPAALAAVLRAWLTHASLRERLRRSASQRRAGLPGWPEAAARLAAVLAAVA